MTNDYGVPILPKSLEIARKLTDDKARERLLTFENAVKSYNPKAQKTLAVYSINGINEMVGSNFPARCLLDRISPVNTRRANIADLLQISDRDGKYLSGAYEDDNAVVLRSLEDPINPTNNYIAKTLAKKLGIKSFKYPIVITNLDIKDDERSDYGLIFVPTKSTKVIVAPSFSGSNNQRRFTFCDANGMPIFNDETDKSGKRQVWTRDKGLSRLYLNRNLDLSSNYEYLA